MEINRNVEQIIQIKKTYSKLKQDSTFAIRFKKLLKDVINNQDFVKLNYAAINRENPQTLIL